MTACKAARSALFRWYDYTNQSPEKPLTCGDLYLRDHRLWPSVHMGTGQPQSGADRQTSGRLEPTSRFAKTTCRKGRIDDSGFHPASPIDKSGLGNWPDDTQRQSVL
jgi:hypothetical protein